MLADAVVLGRALVGRGQDRLGAADVEDHAAWLNAADTVPVMISRLALRVLAEDLLALDLTQALADELGGHLGVDPAEDVGVELRDLDQVADLRVGLVLLGLVDGELGLRVLDLVDDMHRANTR